MRHGFPFGLHARLFFEVMLDETRPNTDVAVLSGLTREVQAYLLDEFGVIGVQTEDRTISQHMTILDLGTLWVGVHTSDELEFTSRKMQDEAIDLALALDAAFPALNCTSESLVIVPESTPHNVLMPIKNMMMDENIDWGTTAEAPRPHTVWQKEEWSDAQHFIQPHNRLLYKLPRDQER